MQTDEDYTWDDADIVVQEVNAIAVYLNQFGDVVIRQHHQFSGDHFVVIPIEHVQAVADALETRGAK